MPKKKPKTKYKTMYMHTIDGGPAYFNGKGIYFSVPGGKPVTLANSLAQIKKEQKIDAEVFKGSEKKHGGWDMGCVRVRVPV